MTMLVACSEVDPKTPKASQATTSATAEIPDVAEQGPVRAGVPEAMQACLECHAEIVDTYLSQHGMARSLGPPGTPEPGMVVNPRSGNRYEIIIEQEGALLQATTPGGGTRYQRIVGRVGAGLYDTSWIGAEVDPFTYEDTGRLFFTPVESLTDHGLVLSPFELHDQSPGLDLPFTENCLTCHTLDDTARLPGAAVGPDGKTIYPANQLGSDAFDHLQPLGCEACHGNARSHVEMMSGLPDDRPSSDFFSLRTANRQRDACARCHLQGDARFELVPTPAPNAPLAGQIPVLVPAHAGDDFRFVGQVERLALSMCFQTSPEMTCTTCHDPHIGVATQGTERFDDACKRCHDMAPVHTTLTVEQVTGTQARTEDGCVDCHIRRSEPFDLPHLRTADHFIRRRISRPAKTGAHRQFADPAGPVEVFDDGRLSPLLALAAGQRWEKGVLAMGMVTMGRMEEAVRYFDAFPLPGAPEAVRPTAPEPLVPLETNASFHHMRGLALMMAGRLEEAKAAFTDALTLDPFYTGARMERLQVRILTGDLEGALKDSDAVLAAHPKAEKPWILRSTLALRIKAIPMAISALETSAHLWASDASMWRQLAMLYQQIGQAGKARQALDRARALHPEIVLDSGQHTP